LGWWNGVAGGDLDGDGDIDFVATNFGLNTRYHASNKEPALLYYGDLAGLGEFDLVEAYYDDGKLLPVRDRLFSSLAAPWLTDEYPTHEAFGRATLEEIYMPESLRAAQALSVNTLESAVFVNNGQAVFDFRPLPRLAQASPGFGAALVDADADGAVDLYIVQNFYTPQPGLGRMDGGVSLLLRGDGRGGFSPVPSETSGLVVPGDAKSLALVDLNGDGWQDVVVGVNDAPVAAFENQASKVLASEHGRPLNVRLRGRAGNRAAIGARISVRLDDGSAQTAEIYGGGGYLTQSSAEHSFGIPKERRVISIDVRWPNGASSTVAPDADQQRLVISQP
jgi:hypothetical protein